MATSTEDLLRELAPQVLGVLMRRYGGLDTCEDAVQEALLDAATQWPASGTPDNPRGWLLTVATRRLTDMLRGESARRRREGAVYLATPPAALAEAGSGFPGAPGGADLLLGAADALRHRRLGDSERPRDLRRGQPADGA